MIKKIIYVLTLLIAFMISSLSYTSITLIDDCYIGAIPDYVTIQEDKDILYFYLDFQGDIKEGIDNILKYCQDNKQTMMMISSFNDAGTNYINWYFYSQNRNDLDGLKIKKQQDIDFSQYSKKMYYTTDRKAKNSAGQFVTIDSHYYENAPHQYNLYNMNGIDEVIKNNDNKIAMQLYTDHTEKLLNDITIILKESNISFQNITEGYSPAQIKIVNNEKMEKLFMMFILSIVLIVLLLMIDVLKMKRTIMIKRLNGLSILKIIKSEYLLFFISEIILFIIVLIGSMYLMTGKRNIYNANYYDLVKPFLLIFISFMMLFGIIIYIFIYFTTHLKYLKSSYHIKNIAQMNVVLKVVVICLLVTPITSLISNVKEYATSYNVFVDNQEIIENMAYIDGNLNSVSKTYEVFDYLNQNEGIYVDFQTYAYNTSEALKEVLSDVDDEDIAEMAIDYPFIFANANYLDKHHIQDENGHELDLHQYKEDIILVPEKYRNENIEKIMFGRHLDIIYIQNTDEYLNYSLQSPYYLSNPVIRLITHKTDDVQITNMYLDISHKSVEDYQKELFQLTDDAANIMKQSSLIYYLIRNVKNDLQDAVFILAIYIIFMMIFIYQTTYLYLNENQKSLSLMYMYGFSLKERYQELFVYTFMTYGILLFVGLFLLHLDFGSLFLFVLISLLFELLVQLSLIKAFENKNIVNILKGEVY